MPMTRKPAHRCLLAILCVRKKDTRIPSGSANLWLALALRPLSREEGRPELLGFRSHSKGFYINHWTSRSPVGPQKHERSLPNAYGRARPAGRVDRGPGTMLHHL